MKIHPVLIGVLNAIIPGLGYLIVRERIVFGWLMLASFILYIPLMFIDPAHQQLIFAQTDTGRLFESLIMILAIFAFGYDAYDLARKKQIATTVPTAL